MTDRKERQHVIEVLQNMVDWMESKNYIVANPERRRALGYAIASIKTDLKYDLLYEETSGQADKATTKNDLAVDAVSRKALIDWLKNWTLGDASPLIDFVNSMPPVTPIRPKGHWINKHCFVDSWSCSAECSSCHKRSNGYIHDNGYGLESTYDDFCPKCGSDNREVEK